MAPYTGWIFGTIVLVLLILILLSTTGHLH